MSVDITGIRFKGDRRGDDIIDPLLSTESAALARLFTELNRRSVTHKEVQLETRYLTGLEMGDMMATTESTTGRVIKGRVTGIRVVGSIQEPSGDGDPYLGHILTLESPTDFSSP